jgi:type 1 glutamine amidotransferase
VSSRPLLAVHAAANTFPDSEAWTAAVGGRWVPGVSWHPPQNEFTAVPAASRPSAPFRDLAPFIVTDERYLDLVPSADGGAGAGAGRRELYRHADDDGRLQQSVWVQDRGGVRSAYDAYGHDEESYRSDGHRTLVRGILRWLLAG